MYQHAIATVSDDRYFPAMWALLNSVYAYHQRELRVYVFLHGAICPRRRRRLDDHPLGEALTIVETDVFQPAPTGCWEAKQQVFAFLLGKARHVCLLDADIVLLSQLTDVFAASEAGLIFTSRDGGDLQFGEEYQCYSSAIVGERMAYVNSGFLCLDIIKHWDLVGLWGFTSRYGSYTSNGGWPLGLPGHGDQGLFNALLMLLRKQPHLFAQEGAEWCNSQAAWSANDYLEIERRDSGMLTVTNLETGRRQRLLHCSGPKWWLPDGRERFSGWKHFLECFDHFAKWPIAIKPS